MLPHFLLVRFHQKIYSDKGLIDILFAANFPFPDLNPEDKALSKGVVSEQHTCGIRFLYVTRIYWTASLELVREKDLENKIAITHFLPKHPYSYMKIVHKCYYSLNYFSAKNNYSCKNKNNTYCNQLGQMKY